MLRVGTTSCHGGLLGRVRPLPSLDDESRGREGGAEGQALVAACSFEAEACVAFDAFAAALSALAFS